jgi:hypothetical protein
VRATKDLDVWTRGGLDNAARVHQALASFGAPFADQPVHVLSRRHLIQNKRAAGRLQDLADVEALEKGHR